MAGTTHTTGQARTTHMTGQARTTHMTGQARATHMTGPAQSDPTVSVRSGYGVSPSRTGVPSSPAVQPAGAHSGETARTSRSVRPLHIARTTVAIVAVAAVGFAGCSTGESGAEDVDSPVDARADERVLGPAFVGPSGSRSGVPQGWAHNAAGARAAAVSAVALTGEIAKAGFITRGDMIDALATRGFAPELAVTTEQQLVDLADALGAVEFVPPEVTWAEIPLTARVTHADDASARVEVWSVLVIATADARVPRQAWRTVTIDLAWEDEDWKVDGWSNRAGPTPALAAAAAVSSGDEVSEVADWPPADARLPDDADGGGANLRADDDTGADPDSDGATGTEGSGGRGNEGGGGRGEGGSPPAPGAPGGHDQESSTGRDTSGAVAPSGAGATRSPRPRAHNGRVLTGGTTVRAGPSSSGSGSDGAAVPDMQGGPPFGGDG